MNAPSPLPYTLSQIIGTVEWQAVTVGESGDKVYRLVGDTTRYLKIGHNLSGEAQRLRWLVRHLPVPDVHYFGEYEGQDYLLMSEIRGLMVHVTDLSPLKRVQLMAHGLRLFHAAPQADCPFDWSLQQQLAASRRNIAQGIDDDLSQPYTGMSPEEAFTDLLTQLPDGKEDHVVVHGDYCLPNILIDPETETITGFIDLGRSGVADRYTDIAVGMRSIVHNLGVEWQQPFLDAYDIDPDFDKINFYRKIDNFN